VNNTISISGPLFVFLIDYYINGVTINKKQIVGIALGILGVILAINADYFMSQLNDDYHQESSYEHYLVEDIKIKLLLSFIAVLSNLIWAYAIVLQKKIKHVPGIKISYFLGLELIFSSSIVYSFGSV
jgi:drug/metabolite transporter (DMT)-like permease